MLDVSCVVLFSFVFAKLDDGSVTINVVNKKAVKEKGNITHCPRHKEFVLLKNQNNP